MPVWKCGRRGASISSHVSSHVSSLRPSPLWRIASPPHSTHGPSAPTQEQSQGGSCCYLEARVLRVALCELPVLKFLL